MRVKAVGRQPSPSSGRGFCNGGNAARPATFRDAQLTLSGGEAGLRVGRDLPPPGAPVSSPRPPTYCSYAKHNQDGKGSLRYCNNTGKTARVNRRYSGFCQAAMMMQKRSAAPMERSGLTETARPTASWSLSAISRTHGGAHSYAAPSALMPGGARFHRLNAGGQVWGLGRCSWLSRWCA